MEEIILYKKTTDIGDLYTTNIKFTPEWATVVNPQEGTTDERIQEILKEQIKELMNKKV